MASALETALSTLATSITTDVSASVIAVLGLIGSLIVLLVGGPMVFRFLKKFAK